MIFEHVKNTLHRKSGKVDSLSNVVFEPKFFPSFLFSLPTSNNLQFGGGEVKISCYRFGHMTLS